MSPYHEKVVALRPEPIATVQGTLALDLGRGPEESYEPPPLAPALRLEPRERQRLEAWAHRFTQAAVEIAGGDRPVSQLLRWAIPSVYDDLARRAQLVRAAALRESPAIRVQQVRPQVESVHTCWIGDEVAEVSARVRYGQRSRAVAVRFEQRSDRWQAVALEFA
ncbi:MAG: Rv3235 family protein [Nocardioides sp.]